MGAYNDFVEDVKSNIDGIVPYGGTIVPTANEFSIVLAQHIQGGYMALPTLEVLADFPIELMQKDMTIVVSEHERPNGSQHTRTRYYLKTVPVNRLSDTSEDISLYWTVEQTSTVADQSILETQYAPNVNGSRPLFLSSQITSDAYQAGYPSTASFEGGNPSDIVWSDDFDPLKGHAWIRQRINSAQPWGIPVSISAPGDYEQNQYVDFIFKWVPKSSPIPDRPIQPDDFNVLPVGWINTPGDDYDTLIVTNDLYRSSVLKSVYGVLKSEWGIPILISSDPQLVRYGNTPGSSDFFNLTFWRPYFTPGLDTFMATRLLNTDTTWTLIKIDQENGEYADFVFKLLPINADYDTLVASRPTSSVPINGASPNDWSNEPVENTTTDQIQYFCKCTKFIDGSLKTPWSLPHRFDGIDSIVAVIEETPGDTFYRTRDVNGNLVDAFASIDLVSRLYRGVTEITTEINSYKWYRGNTLIIFSNITHKATNLGVGLNDAHTISVDGKTLTITPDAVIITQQYKVGINHTSRTPDYEESIQILDATDDAEAFIVDILAVNGHVFKNQEGLYRFDAKFYKGGELDLANVSFIWTLVDGAGAPIIGALRNSSGVPLSVPVTTQTVYVSGADVDEKAVLILSAFYGAVSRQINVSLTDLSDIQGYDVLYWGLGSSDPGSPTDFTPRTLTKQEVLDLGIGYLDIADGANAWYRIERINGVWGPELRIRGEAGQAAGGIELIIFKNVTAPTVPSIPAVPGSGSIIPAGWTHPATDFAGSEDTRYMTSCTFLLRTDVVADPTVFTRDNYTPVGTYGTLSKIESNPSGTGVDGYNGWSPLFSMEVDGERRILKLVDWFGGTGTKPAGAGTTTSYVGPTGLTSKALATDFRGPAGPDNGYVPPYLIKIGDETATGIGGSVGTSVGPQITLQSITLEAYARPRIIQVFGRVNLRSDNSNSDDYFNVWLDRVIIKPDNSSTVNRVAQTYKRPMIGVNASESATIEYSITVNGSSDKERYNLRLVQSAGGSAFRNAGYLQILVINL